jgi:serine protein kinase
MYVNMLILVSGDSFKTVLVLCVQNAQSLLSFQQEAVMSSHFKGRNAGRETIEMSLDEYLAECKKNKLAFASTAERMLAAIGEPTFVDTRTDDRLSRIFSNKVIKTYPAFREFYGMEEVVEQVVAYFRHAAQGLEERKQILYLLGPVGGGKSSLAEKLKSLMEEIPFYAIKGSPVNESPLALFGKEDYSILEEEYSVPRRYLGGTQSPWLKKRIKEQKGDISNFRILRVYPVIEEIAITKTEPGDENNQDISSLVGKADIRKLSSHAQSDADAYDYSGGLCQGNRGIMEFVEMFKAPIKVLHPLLTATQEGNFKPSEPGLGAIPFDGIILAHSNESEWKSFKNNKNNEAFLDRVYVVKVPYCLRISEEVKIYEKLVRESSLGGAPCAPGVYDMMAKFAILSRLVEPENSSAFSKMLVYDGQNLKDIDPKAKSVTEYRDFAGIDEGMDGISTRFAFKILSKVFNFDSTEVAANPVHLLYVLEQQIEREQFPAATEERLVSYVKEHLAERYVEFIGKEIQTAYLESYSEYGQNIFDRYVTFADFWVQDQEYRDPDTGESFDKKSLNDELEKIEKPAGIANPKDFRNEVVNFALRARGKPENGGNNPKWTSYEKLRTVIEKKMFSNTEELLPVISFNAKVSADDAKKHASFVERMSEKGYTPKQVRLLCEWYLRVRKSS